MPHNELLEIGQQTQLGRKRRELVEADLKTTRQWSRITIQSLQASHIELHERGQVRNFARQRAKLVVVEPEVLHALHAEQLARHLRQSHVYQLKTMCES